MHGDVVGLGDGLQGVAGMARLAAGFASGFLAADAGYGKGPEAFYRLTELEETFFIDVPSDFSVYLKPPR